MNGVTEKSAEWLYRGVWLFLVECFRVPELPPTLPDAMKGELQVFPPSRRYLAYMKLYFWIALAAIDGAILVAWILLYTQQPLLAWALAIPALVIAIVSVGVPVLQEQTKPLFVIRVARVFTPQCLV